MSQSAAGRWSTRYAVTRPFVRHAPRIESLKWTIAGVPIAKVLVYRNFFQERPWRGVVQLATDVRELEGMMSTTLTGTASAARTLNEGYGTGAWHGPDLKAALEGISGDDAFWRPGDGRHNIAEIAVHHAYCAHNVRAKLADAIEPFTIAGDDWFDVSHLSWPAILELVEREQQQLATTATDVDEGRSASPLSAAERFDLVLGITCHAVYHAGQIQLIKKLRSDR
jgi:hypothetical protein